MAFTSELSEDESIKALAFARHLATRAQAVGALREINQRRSIHERRKDDGTLVTDIDLKIEQMVRSQVARYRPEDESVLREERGLLADSESGSFWVVDPIDGTDLLAANEMGYVFSVALVIRGIPQVAVVSDPNTRQTWYTRLFQPAWTEWASTQASPLRVNASAELASAPLPPVDPRYQWGHVVSVVKGGQLMELERGSVVRAACGVASGEYDGLIFGRNSPWDMAAAALIAFSAGAEVTDLNGRVPDLDGPIHGCILANPAMHRKLLDLAEEAAARE